MDSLTIRITYSGVVATQSDFEAQFFLKAFGEDLLPAEEAIKVPQQKMPGSIMSEDGKISTSSQHYLSFCNHCLIMFTLLFFFISLNLMKSR